MARWDRVMFVT